MARPRTQENKILDALREADEGLTQEDLRKLGIPKASVSVTLRRLVASGQVLPPTYRLNMHAHWNPEYKIPKKDQKASTIITLDPRREAPKVEVVSLKTVKPWIGKAGGRTMEPNVKEFRRILPISQVVRRGGSETVSYGKGEVSLTYPTKSKSGRRREQLK